MNATNDLVNTIVAMLIVEAVNNPMMSIPVVTEDSNGDYSITITSTYSDERAVINVIAI